jgi:hypothetical protein
MADKKKVCRYDGCERGLYDADYCIFHSKDIHGKKVEFHDTFWKEFEMQKEQEQELYFENGYNFEGFVFPGDISFRSGDVKKETKNVKGKETKRGEKKKEKKKKTCCYRYFTETCNRPLYDDEHCIFHSIYIEEKKTEFNDAFWKEIERLKEKEVYFEGDDLEGFVFSWDISFNKSVNFRNAQFSGNADFRKAQFFITTEFNHTQFSGNADFEQALFCRNADFFASQFSGDANFKYAQFFKNADFSNVQFSGKSEFWNARFSGEARFCSAQFAGETDFREAQFAGEANFWESTFSGMQLTGLFDSLRNKGIHRLLRGRYKITDFKIHLGEVIAKKYPVINRMIKDAWYLNDFQQNNPFVYKLWWLFADCGRSLIRWALWSIVFALYFALNFYLIHYAYPAAFHFNDAIQEKTLWSFIYYSVVTFTTLGFGDIIPTMEWVQRWVMAEVITGYVMLGGLISILANKLARRS